MTDQMKTTTKRIKNLEDTLEKIKNEILYKPKAEPHADPAIRKRDERVLRMIDKIFGGPVPGWQRQQWLKDIGSSLYQGNKNG